MRLCPDTNVLVRAAFPHDDPGQAEQAIRAMEQADTIIISMPVLCELAWVLRSVYHFGTMEIVRTIELLVSAQKIVCDRQLVAFGLAIAKAGGDFADGVIAEAGFLAGADRFVSFDRRAVRLVAAAGREAGVPA